MFIDVFLTNLDLTRQAFSSVFLLYAFSCRNVPLKLAFLAIATSFHLSAIFVFLLFYVVKYFPKLSLVVALFLISMFVLGNSSEINSFINESALSIRDKIPPKIYVYFSYYIDGNGWNLDYLTRLNIIRAILMFAMVFSFFILRPNDELVKQWRYIALISFLVVIFGVLPSRSVSLFADFLFFFLAFIAFRAFMPLAMLFFFPYFLKRMYFLLTAENTSGHLFFSYPEADFAPFYYIFEGSIL